MFQKEGPMEPKPLPAMKRTVAYVNARNFLIPILAPWLTLQVVFGWRHLHLLVKLLVKFLYRYGQRDQPGFNGLVVERKRISF